MAFERSGTRVAGDIWSSYSTRDRTLLTLGAILCYVLFGIVARLFAIPRYPDFQAAILLQPAPLLVIVLVAATLLAGALLASLVAGKVHFESGLFCAAIGLAALSVRGGPARYAFMYDPTGGVYVRLIIETVLLLGCISLGWYALLALRDRGLLKGEPLREDDPDALPAQGLMALAAQVVVMVLLMALLAQTDQKAQVIWAIAIASTVAAIAAHSLFPARPSIWFWSAPFIVAIIGYVLALVGGAPKVGGMPGGAIPALARPLPLDYAAIGTAGSLLGYWTSRKWLHEREEEPHTTGEVEEALENPQA
jgi:hypothetical protein